MEDGLLSLKWNNHKSTFFHILSSLRKKETYTDATLACDGKFFPVHRLVMSTCSDYFGEVFEKTTCKCPVVILKDIKHNDLEALLDYMYLGEVDVKQSELAGLIKAAECLRIKGLAVPDEDPSHRKQTHVPEYRSSPSPKRTRRDSGSSDTMCRYSSSHKSQRPLSPSNSSTRSHATSVPSQASDSLSSPLMPVQSSPHMMPPPPSYVDMGSHPPSESIQKQPTDQSIPIEMIKVEVEDEGNSNNNSHLRPSLDGSSSMGDGGSVGRRDSRSEGDIGDSSSAGGGRTVGKDSLSNSYSDYSGHEVEKVEEQDQLGAYNGSDQLPGPSGVQAAPQMMNWDEEGNFPHNLFGGEDSNQQQVGRLEAAVEVVLEVAGEGANSHFLDSNNGPIKNHLPIQLEAHGSAPSSPSINYNGASLIRGRRSRRGSHFSYSCPYCKKQFMDKSKWSRHLLAHTGEKPFLCNVCSRGFSRKDNLQTHLKDKHRIFTKVVC